MTMEGGLDRLGWERLCKGPRVKWLTWQPGLQLGLEFLSPEFDSYLLLLRYLV